MTAQFAERAQRTNGTLEVGIAGQNAILLMQRVRLARPGTDRVMAHGRRNGREPSA